MTRRWKERPQPAVLATAFGGVAVLLLGASPVVAQLPPTGPELHVNAYTEGAQRNAAVASDSSGNFVVTWVGAAQDGDGDGIFGRFYDSLGNSLGDELQVSTFTSDDQDQVAAASDGDGNVLVVWRSNAQDGSTDSVFGQRWNIDGSVAGSEFQISTYTAGLQRNPSVAASLGGGFLAVWQSHRDGNAAGVFGQRYQSDGAAVGGEFQISTYTIEAQGVPRAALTPSGEFVVVWRSIDQDGSGYGVFGQRFDAAGSGVGTELQVTAYTVGDQGKGVVGVAADGSFVVAWEDEGYRDGDESAIFARRFGSDGAAIGGDFLVNSFTIGTQTNPAVVIDGTGTATVVWESRGSHDGNLDGNFGQRFDSSGQLLGAEFQINSYTTADQRAPAIAVDGSGGLVLAWQSDEQDGSGTGVFAQRFALCGTTPASGCRAAGKSILILKDNTDDGKDKLVWKWIKGEATEASDFGDPVNGTTEYTLCVYDSLAGGRLLTKRVAPAQGTCAGKDCWKVIGPAASPKGFKYKDKDRTPDGLLKIVLKAGDTGKAKAIVKGKGANLAMPALGLTPPVTAQLVHEGGTCWSATFPDNPANVKKNVAALFKGKVP